MQATDIQEDEIKTSTNLAFVEGAGEKLRCMLRSHKIRSFFATEDKNDIVYEIDCTNCEALYLGESKKSLIFAFR